MLQENSSFHSQVSTPIFYFPESGRYMIDFSISNPLGQDQLMQEIEIDILDTTSLELTDVALCLGDSIQLSPTITGDTTMVSWYPETAISRTDILRPIISPEQSTDFILEVTTIDGCTTKDTLNATVFPRPTTFAIGTDNISPGDTIQLFAIGAESYLWTPDSSLSDAQIPNPLAFPLETTLYFVEGRNGQECSSIDSVLIEVDLATSISSSLGASLFDVKLSPNPTRDEVQFSAELAMGGVLVIELVNALGKRHTIFSRRISRGSFRYRYDLSSTFLPGVYWVNWKMNRFNMAQMLILY